MRSLGEAVGHVVRAVRSDPGASDAKATARAPDVSREEVRRSVEEAAGETAGGERVTLRRTTIEEIEIDRRP